MDQGSATPGTTRLDGFFGRAAGFGLGLGYEFGPPLALVLGFGAGLVLLIVDMKAHG